MATEKPSVIDNESQDSAVLALQPPGSTVAQGNEFTPRACLALLGAFAVLFCTVGFANAFGVFQEYYSLNFLVNESQSNLSWLGSINVFCVFAGTVASGILHDKYGPRLLICLGSLLTLLGIFMTSLCSKYYQFVLAQGLLLGFGMSLSFAPAYATVQLYFKKNVGLALGITVSGSSLGGVIWPIVLHNLFKEVTFGWAVRITGFIMLPLLGIACLTIRSPRRVDEHKSLEVDLSCAKNPVLILLSGGLFLVYLGLFTPFFYVTQWTIYLGLDANLAFYMISILNAASLFGRILPGLWADRYGPYNMMILSAGFSGIVCLCWTTATSIGRIVVFSLAYGFFSGAIISLQGACVARVVKKEQFGTSVGILMGIVSIACLTGTPINGQLLDRWNYIGIAMFSGLLLLLGAIFVLVARWKIERSLFANT